MKSLQQRLAEQPRSTHGAHEAMALHAEEVFAELKGILPLLLGKRQNGPFINLALPKAVTQSRQSLLQSARDLALCYQLTLVSFVAATRNRDQQTGEVALGALLLTADEEGANLQLPWALSFDDEANLTSFSRAEPSGEVVARHEWKLVFERDPKDGTARMDAYDRLVGAFGGKEELPEP